MSKSKVPKIKIQEHELNNFTTENLQIDPFWHDLYGI